MEKEFKYITDFPETYSCYGKDQWFQQHCNSIVVINCKSSAIYYPEHWTPLSIKCAFNGKEFYKFTNTTYAVQDDNFLLLNEGNIYESYINSESVTESFTLNFTSDNLKSLAAYVSTKKNGLIEYNTNEIVPEFRVIEKLYPHTNRTLGYINSIRNFYRTGEPDGNKLFEFFHLFLLELISLNKKTSLEIDQISAKKRITREELYKRLHISRDYIQSCYNENISLESLSKICFLNPFYLLREFKRYFNMTPHQYLTQVRMQEAKRLIVQNNCTIFEVAMNVGYNDVSSFSKLFKNQFGVSPAALRKDCF